LNSEFTSPQQNYDTPLTFGILNGSLEVRVF
jgi:hypothetical protein